MENFWVRLSNRASWTKDGIYDKQFLYHFNATL